MLIKKDFERADLTTLLHFMNTPFRKNIYVPVPQQTMSLMNDSVNNMDNMPSSRRYFEELFSSCTDLSNRSSIYQNILYLRKSLLPILFGRGELFFGQFEDSRFAIYRSKLKLYADMVLLNYENNGVKRGFALQKLIGAEVPDKEELDSDDLDRLGGPREFFKKLFSVSPFSIIMFDKKSLTIHTYCPAETNRQEFGK